MARSSSHVWPSRTLRRGRHGQAPAGAKKEGWQSAARGCAHLGGFVEEGAGVVAGVGERAHDGRAAALQALAQCRAQGPPVPVAQVAPPVRYHLRTPFHTFKTLAG